MSRHAALLAAAALVLAFGSGPAPAQKLPAALPGIMTVQDEPEPSAPKPPPDACAVPDTVLDIHTTLPVAAARISRDRDLRILLLNTRTGSGAASGGRTDEGYPKRLEAELAQRLPGVRVSVVSRSEPGMTAAEMVDQLARDVFPDRPSLVIWQTGTNDAVKRHDIDEFGAALAAGIDRIREQQIDVMLMDMQFNPQMASLVNFDPYSEYMKQIAQAKDVFLFPRLDIMKYWAESGAMDLSVTGKEEEKRTARFVHRCIGHLLATTIAAMLTPEPTPQP